MNCYIRQTWFNKCSLSVRMILERIKSANTCRSINITASTFFHSNPIRQRCEWQTHVFLSRIGEEYRGSWSKRVLRVITCDAQYIPRACSDQSNRVDTHCFFTWHNKTQLPNMLLEGLRWWMTTNNNIFS